MKPPARQRTPVLETKRGIDLAPMVDIVFLLLAYFLINSTLAKTPAIRVNLPESRTSSYVSENSIDILIRSDGTVFLNNAAVKPRALTARLKAIISTRRTGKTPDVNIQGDSRAQYQHIMSVIDAVRSAGLTNFNLTALRR